MQNPKPQLTEIPPADRHSAVPVAPPPERLASVWATRITTVVGLSFLALALLIWFFRPGHYRLVLALLVVAMFAAILHSYSFETGHQ